MIKNHHIEDALEMLKKSPLKVTEQRVSMINILFENGASHFTAEEIFKEVKERSLYISLATIYNCLNQFKEFGIIKAVKVSSNKIFFDTNLKDHYHFFCQESGKLTDIRTSHVKISRLPKLPKGKKLKSIEVIINISE